MSANTTTKTKQHYCVSCRNTFISDIVIFPPWGKLCPDCEKQKRITTRNTRGSGSIERFFVGQPKSFDI